jgi:hypothetical protein
MLSSKLQPSARKSAIINAGFAVASGKCELLIPSELKTHTIVICETVETVGQVVDFARDIDSRFASISKAASDSLSLALKSASEESYSALCANMRTELLRRHVNSLTGKDCQKRRARAKEFIDKFMAALYNRKYSK